MDTELPDWLVENYTEIVAQRGISWDELALEMDEFNAPGLAAWARTQAPETATAPPPTQATAPDDTETADAPPAETA